MSVTSTIFGSPGLNTSYGFLHNLFHLKPHEHKRSSNHILKAINKRFGTQAPQAIEPRNTPQTYLFAVVTAEHDIGVTSHLYLRE